MASRLAGLHFALRTLLNQEARQEAPAVLDEALGRAALGYFGTLIGALAGYQPGRPVPPVSAQLTTRVSQELAPFLIEETIAATGGGVVARPVGLLYPLRLTARYEQGEDAAPLERGLSVLTEQAWDGRINSVLLPPTQEHPIARETRTGWVVVPRPASVDVRGYRAPTDPALVYQTDPLTGEPLTDPTTDEPLIDTAATVEPEWLPLSDTEIIRRACELLGLRTGDRPAQEFARVTANQPN